MSAPPPSITFRRSERRFRPLAVLVSGLDIFRSGLRVVLVTGLRQFALELCKPVRGVGRGDDQKQADNERPRGLYSEK